ncbi:hypothetical protein ACXLRP_001033 [Acinetobacter baumannii]|jgi:hypothetical protein|uniref:hypothetical protein n=4 Tax=Acinetobacter baumannii TaxID=470 RepID=UPI0002AEDFAC|nr:hypothetical protein [Acinetobacter baumannii]AYY53589.1 hypothetical protein EGX83_10135 [Acinetobacter baumannii]EHU1357206.1 hypothetical protein [Acinetobacter baumannii]EHU2501087.1 hypothetical protein [Acinetobacter baumannii]EHZ7970947.1 hypothetical protein [Acinetobacter baumannii]EIO2225897.1 hypothetical protein [Acinetobacter baumannii]
MPSYLTIDQVIETIRSHLDKTFTFMNLSDLVAQKVLNPVFLYKGYIAVVSQNKVINFENSTCYLKPKISNDLINLLDGRKEKITISWLESCPYTVDGNFDNRLLEILGCTETGFLLYNYNVEDSPMSLPTDLDFFLHSHPPYVFSLERSMLKVEKKELELFLKRTEKNTYSHADEKNLRIIGAILNVLDQNPSRKINQSFIAAQIEEMTKNTEAGMSSSSLTKVFADANKAIKPFLKK